MSRRKPLTWDEVYLPDIASFLSPEEQAAIAASIISVKPRNGIGFGWRGLDAPGAECVAVTECCSCGTLSTFDFTPDDLPKEIRP